MSVKIKYNLEYREGGERKELPIEVDFISQRVIREYSEWQSTVCATSEIWNKISDLNTEIGSLKKEKNNRALIAIKQKEIEDFNLKLKEIGSGDFFKKRFELIKRILSDNGIKDEKYFKYEFWDEQVDPNDIVKFLYTCINKDFEGKKKL